MAQRTDHPAASAGQPASKPQTARSERLSYWLYFTGQSMSYTLLSSFLTAYLMLIGINLTEIATAMVLVKLWDSVNDAIFGWLFDKIHFKSGHRSLPWLRMTLVLIPLTTIFVFQIPQGLSPTAKIIWFVVGYLLWDIAYTLSDIPIYNLVTMMTTDLIERNSLLAIARFFALGGAFVTSIAATFLVSEKVGFSFGQTAILLTVLVVLTMIPIAIKGKERIHPKHAEANYTFRQMGHYLRTNKYLLLYYLGYFISGVALTNAPLDLFVSYYLFGSALFSTVTLVSQSLPIAIISLLIGKLLKHVDKFRLFYWATVAFALLGVLVYLGGYTSPVRYILLIALRSIPQGVILTLSLTFTPDTVEYGQYKTGVDARGIAFAIQSFAAKLISLAQPLGLFILTWFNWHTTSATSFQALADQHVTQTPAALTGLWFTVTLIPVAGALLSLIPFSLYKLNDHDVQLMADYNAGKATREATDHALSRKY